MKLATFLIIFSIIFIEIFAEQTDLRELIFKPYSSKNKKLIEEPQVTTLKTEVLVRSNTLLKVLGNYSPTNKNNSWYLDNENEIKNSNLIDYQGNEYDTKNCYDENSNDCVGKVFLKFQIKDINTDNEKQLPKIKIVEFATNNDKMLIEITLKFNAEEEIPPKEYTYKVQEFNLPKLGVEPNTILNLQFNNFSPNNVTWIFDFEDIFDITEDDSVVYLGKEIDDEEDVTIFKFLINEVREHSSSGLLSFLMQEPNNKQRVNIFLKPKEKDLPNEFTLKPKESDKELEVEVESNFLLNIELPFDFATAYRWFLENDEEIDKNEHIENTSIDYKSACNTIAPGVDPSDCTGIDIFRFRIRDVTDNDQLPKLKMVNRMSVQTKRKRFTEETQTLEIILKLKNNSAVPKEECSFNGYSCCSKANPKVHYQDKDGEWGVENGKWCFIQKGKEEKKEESSNCVSQDIGYPVCKTTKKVVTTDKDGEWGVENGQWCIMCN